MSNQIPLPFGKFDRFSFELFWPGSNQQVLAFLQQSLIQDHIANVYLWGEDGTGKSHLLQASCALAASRMKTVIYIPLTEKAQFAPDLLNGIELLDLVCIDDVDEVVGDPEWELALFNLYNRMFALKNSLYLSARTSPGGLDIKLPDLKSRLTAGVTWHLSNLDEKDRLLALQDRAKSRGFELSDEVIEYLSRRVARDMHSLFSWLDKLDQATLVSKKRITVPFVRELLEE